MTRSRGFAFTDYEMDIEFYNEFEPRYIIIGEEVCPKTKRLHWQGYILFPKKMDWDKLRKRFEPRHIECAKASATKNAKYCSKDGKLVLERGDKPKQGNRTDIEICKEILAKTGKMREVVEVSNNYQSIRTCEKYLTYKEPNRKWDTEVYWFFGETGTGKTRKAMEMAGDDVWVSGRNLKWWEGYDAHENVIIDDFRGDFCTFHELLRILDRYEYRVEVKGGSRQLLAKRIWITSCKSPWEVYDKSDEDVGQLIRRISKVVKFEPEGEREIDTTIRPRSRRTLIGARLKPREIPKELEL